MKTINNLLPLWVALMIIITSIYLVLSDYISLVLHIIICFSAVMLQLLLTKINE